MFGTKPVCSQRWTRCARQRSQPAIHGSSVSSVETHRPAAVDPTGRQHQADRLAAERHPGQVGRGRHRRLPVAEHQREVDLAVGEQGQGLRRLGLGQRHVDAGAALAEPGQRLRHQRGRRRREGGQPHPAPAQCGDAGQLLLGHGQLGGDRVGPGHQQGARLGGRHAPGSAEQQGAARLPLELPQVLADRRLGPAELTGGRAEGAGADHGAEDHQSARVHDYQHRDPSTAYGNAKQAKSSQGAFVATRMDGCARLA